MRKRRICNARIDQGCCATSSVQLVRSGVVLRVRGPCHARIDTMDPRTHWTMHFYLINRHPLPRFSAEPGRAFAGALRMAVAPQLRGSTLYFALTCAYIPAASSCSFNAAANDRLPVNDKRISLIALHECSPIYSTICSLQITAAQISSSPGLDALFCQCGHTAC